MIYLEVQGVRKHFGPEPVLDGVTFELRAGERVGLVGPNGSGKTTLMRILAGREDPDAGAVRLHPSLHLGYLEQQPDWQPGRTLWEEAQGALAGLIALEQESVSVAEALAETADPLEHKRLADRFDHLQHELERRDAYNLDHKIERVLAGLRFRSESFRQPIDSLSGGEQNRLMLAKLLLAEPNLMLLDEPSNHLDIEATEWLEKFLVDSSAAMLVVSHDRYFLDKVTNRTLEIFAGTTDSYIGNFSAYWQQKAERLLVQQRTYEKQQIEIAKTKEFIRRNHYGQKAAQAEDRRKKLERIEEVPPPRQITVPPMGFAKATRSGDIVLRAKGLGKAFDRPLFRGLDIEIIRGQRWGLLGPNGCGKTTLLRCLLGLEQPDEGCVYLGAGLTIGYFDQQLTQVDGESIVMDAISPWRDDFLAQKRRDLLARFGLTGDTALQRVDSLSGGERCRAALARLAAAAANFLVLDEPTNHLDLWARDALERAIVECEATVLFVSHDRFFVNRLADHLLVVDGGQVRVVEGNYDAFHDQQAARTNPPDDEGDDDDCSAGASAVKVKAKKKDRDKRPSEAPAAKKEQPKRRFPFRKVADIEEEILSREAAVESLVNQLSTEAVYRDGERVRQHKQQIAAEQETLKTLYEHLDEATRLNW
jgi:ATP-binding cassette, subfamily F, member 3